MSQQVEMQADWSGKSFIECLEWVSKKSQQHYALAVSTMVAQDTGGKGPVPMQIGALSPLAASVGLTDASQAEGDQQRQPLLRPFNKGIGRVWARDPRTYRDFACSDMKTIISNTNRWPLATTAGRNIDGKTMHI